MSGDRTTTTLGSVRSAVARGASVERDGVSYDGLAALIDEIGDEPFVLQLLYFAKEPAFASLARAAMEAGPEQRAWLANNAARLMAQSQRGSRNRPPAPLYVVNED